VSEVPPQWVIDQITVAAVREGRNPTELRAAVVKLFEKTRPSLSLGDRWNAAAFAAIEAVRARGSGPSLVPPAAAGDYGRLWRVTDKGDKWVPLRSEFEDVLLLEHHFLAFRDSRELRRYDPAAGFFTRDGDTYIGEWIRQRFSEKKEEVGQDITASAGFVSEVTSTIRDRSYRERSDINPPWGLPLRNGLFNVRTRTLRAHAPEPAFTFGLPVAWDPGATAPLFEAFLDRALPDPQLREVGLEIAGYCLWPTSALRRAAFFIGPTSTGKTTYLDVIRGVLGSENTTSIDLGGLVDSRFAAAELYCRLANIRSDLPTRLVRNVGLFQELTGGRDTVTAEKKHQNPFQFCPTAKLLFSANRLPRIAGATPAFWLRWLLIPFEVQIGREEDKSDYAAVLLREADGIFRLFVEASARLLERGRFPELPIEVRGRWLRNSDPSLYVCQNEVVDAAGGSVDLKDLVQRVEEICDEEGIDELPDGREVGAALRRAHPRARTVRFGPRDQRRTTYWDVSWARKPLAVAGWGISDDKCLPGATGGFTTTGKANSEERLEGVVDPPVAPGIDSLTVKARPATARGAEQDPIPKGGDPE
jgi:P4 family phage/plasmid primase-like protien